MALIVCPECEREVSATVETCPHCGFDIAKYVCLMVEAEEEADRQRLEEEDKRNREEEREQRRAQFALMKAKYFGTKKQRLSAILAAIIVLATIIAGIAVYLKKTEALRGIKENTQAVLDYSEDIEQVLSSIEDHYGGRVDSWHVTIFRLADRRIGDLRERYHGLTDSDRQLYHIFLLDEYHISWSVLNETFVKYGLVSASNNEAIEKDDTYYQELITAQYNERKEVLGEVAVVEIHLSTAGDNYIISGSVKNTTQYTVYFVKVKVALMDADNNVINTDSTYAVGDEGLAPGEMTTFECYIDIVEGAEYYKAYVYDYD